MSLIKSIGYLLRAVIKKLNSSNRIETPFIAPYVEDEELEILVELACGHIMRKKDDKKATDATFGQIGSNSLLANLSITEATRCPICRSELLANREAGREHDFGVAASRIAEERMTLDKKRELCVLERQGTADEHNMSFGETLIEVRRRAKKALSVKGAGGSSVGFDGA
ncbi:MAG: hypothetical protein Q9175_004244 [Cornicularia normoerica]